MDIGDICSIICAFCYLITMIQYGKAIKENKSLKQQNDLLIAENTRLNNLNNADTK